MDTMQRVEQFFEHVRELEQSDSVADSVLNDDALRLRDLKAEYNDLRLINEVKQAEQLIPEILELEKKLVDKRKTTDGAGNVLDALKRHPGSALAKEGTKAYDALADDLEKAKQQASDVLGRVTQLRDQFLQALREYASSVGVVVFISSKLRKLARALDLQPPAPYKPTQIVNLFPSEEQIRGDRAYQMAQFSG